MWGLFEKVRQCTDGFVSTFSSLSNCKTSKHSFPFGTSSHLRVRVQEGAWVSKITGFFYKAYSMSHAALASTLCSPGCPCARLLLSIRANICHVAVEIRVFSRMPALLMIRRNGYVSRSPPTLDCVTQVVFDGHFKAPVTVESWSRKEKLKLSNTQKYKREGSTFQGWKTAAQGVVQTAGLVWLSDSFCLKAVGVCARVRVCRVLERVFSSRWA